MKQLEADIVVLSAGTGGLAAAVTAAEGGASVIAFEKASTTGGTANMGNGIFGVESRLQRIKEYPLSREEAFKIYMDFSHWRVNARLVKTFIDKSASTIDWLESLGVEFSVLNCSHGFGNYYTWHLVKVPAGTDDKHRRAATMMKILKERAKELGIRILLRTPAKKILKEDGRIVGVVAKDGSGEDIQAKAKAVIIATGGRIGGVLQVLPGVVGDGIRMAREAGAAVSENNAEPTSSRDAMPVVGPHGDFPSVGIAFEQAGLIVNLLGERFMNEEITVNSPFGDSAIALQKNRCAITIFDEDAKNHYIEYLDHVPGLVGESESMTKASNFNAELKQALDRGADNIFVADSIEELASKIGVNPDALWETIEEYNKACETGRDELFNKNHKWLRPVKQPKFYANKRVAREMTGWEGIKINYKTEVLTEDHTVIPGLYAVGMDAACNIYYDIYPNILPATAMGFAINSGRMAAENALEYVKSIGT